ncbi:hypothetical protein L53_01190 [Hyphomonas sp. L-53-1-40]|nr:hypothetical protein L53_01190 [Hyphomonas sp. L-53-1-40]
MILSYAVFHIGNTILVRDNSDCAALLLSFTKIWGICRCNFVKSAAIGIRLSQLKIGFVPGIFSLKRWGHTTPSCYATGLTGHDPFDKFIVGQVSGFSGAIS